MCLNKNLSAANIKNNHKSIKVSPIVWSYLTGIQSNLTNWYIRLHSPTGASCAHLFIKSR